MFRLIEILFVFSVPIFTVFDFWCYRAAGWTRFGSSLHVLPGGGFLAYRRHKRGWEPRWDIRYGWQWWNRPVRGFGFGFFTIAWHRHPSGTFYHNGSRIMCHLNKIPRRRSF